MPNNPPLPRVIIPPLSSVETTTAPREEVPSPTLNDLRAAVDALKQPRRPELVTEAPNDSDEPESAEATKHEETSDTARRL